MSLVEIEVDRAAVIKWYVRESRTVARDLRPHRSGRLLFAADRAAQSDRLLRGAPSGVQRHRVPQARTRPAGGRCPARGAVRARHRSRQRRRPPCPAAAPRREWPSRDEVLAFADACDRAVLDALEHAPFVDDRPAMHRAQALYTALEHEAMHQETLLYMWHRLPHSQKNKPAGVATRWTARRRHVRASAFRRRGHARWIASTAPAGPTTRRDRGAGRLRVGQRIRAPHASTFRRSRSTCTT